jgi:hypothetical protein
MPATARGHRRHIVDVSRFVHPLEPFAGGRFPRWASRLGHQTSRLEPGGNLSKALRLLGVIARVVIQKPRIVVKKCHAAKCWGTKPAARKSGLFTGDDRLLNGCNIVAG